MSELDDRAKQVEAFKSVFKSQNINDLKSKGRYYLHTDIACPVSARVILEEARRLGIDGKLFEVPMFEDAWHVVVILDDMNENDICLHTFPDFKITVQEARKIGKDITENFLSSPWEQLM